MAFSSQRCNPGKYLFYLLQAPSHVAGRRDRHCDGNSAIDDTNVWSTFSGFPLPPLAEQKRIVAKVDQLMRLCDALQAGLVQTETRRRNVTAVVLQTH